MPTSVVRAALVATVVATAAIPVTPAPPASVAAIECNAEVFISHCQGWQIGDIKNETPYHLTFDHGKRQNIKAKTLVIPSGTSGAVEGISGYAASPPAVNFRYRYNDPKNPDKGGVCDVSVDSGPGG